MQCSANCNMRYEDNLCLNEYRGWVNVWKPVATSGILSLQFVTFFWPRHHYLFHWELFSKADTSLKRIVLTGSECALPNRVLDSSTFLVCAQQFSCWFKVASLFMLCIIYWFPPNGLQIKEKQKTTLPEGFNWKQRNTRNHWATKWGRRQTQEYSWVIYPFWNFFFNGFFLFRHVHIRLNKAKKRCTLRFSREYCSQFPIFPWLSGVWLSRSITGFDGPPSCNWFLKESETCPGG